MNEHAKRIQRPRCFLVYALAPQNLSAAEANRIFNEFIDDQNLPLVIYHDHFIGQPGGLAIFFVDTPEARDALLNQKHLEGWRVEIQETEWAGKSIRNVIAKRGTGDPWIVLGAHFDTRIHADQDPDPSLKDDPVPGANDGASGVAVLLELARVIPQSIDKEIWLVFFDAEDNGRFEGWDWTLGSPEFVKNNSVRPRAVIVVDRTVGSVWQNDVFDRQVVQSQRAGEHIQQPERAGVERPRERLGNITAAKWAEPAGRIGDAGRGGC